MRNLWRLQPLSMASTTSLAQLLLFCVRYYGHRAVSHRLSFHGLIGAWYFLCFGMNYNEYVQGIYSVCIALILFLNG
jgi:hypothetical protein